MSVPNAKAFTKKYRLLGYSLAVVTPIVVLKYVFHLLDWEVLPLTSLHNGIISGAIFVIGFLLSATITDYKESERIPSEFAAILENMYEDARALHAVYPDFNIDKMQQRLRRIAVAFGTDVRRRKQGTQLHIHKLNDSFIAMEAAGVPANFIARLKQQQFQLTNRLFRVNYIQRTNSIPSATVLARGITVLALSLLLLTEIEPFAAGMISIGIIAFIVIYTQRLIRVIRTPFRAEGTTMDDVSLFLIDRTADHLGRASRPSKSTH